MPTPRGDQPVSQTPAPPDPGLAPLRRVEGELRLLLDELHAVEAAWDDRLRRVHPSFRDSALNLLHYMALRRHDLSDLQTRLAELGLSSLGRCEAHVLSALATVHRVVLRLLDQPTPPDAASPALSMSVGRALLERHTQAAFTPVPGASEPAAADAEPEAPPTRIMVTMPSEAAGPAGQSLLTGLLAAGMSVARINCAHDDPGAWAGMLANLDRAKGDHPSPARARCAVYMDLAGPKVRTGPIEPAPPVVKLSPVRDDLGRLLAPARVVLVAGSFPSSITADVLADAARVLVPNLPHTPAVPVADHWIASLRLGDRVKLRDARGKARRLTIEHVSPAHRWSSSSEFPVTAFAVARTRQTTYLAPGVQLLRRTRRVDPRSSSAQPPSLDTPPTCEPAHAPRPAREPKVLRSALVRPFEGEPGSIELAVGDTLILTGEPITARRHPADAHSAHNPAPHPSANPAAHPRIACTLPDVLADILPGDRVVFDDGRITAVVRAVDDLNAEIVVTHTRSSLPVPAPASTGTPATHFDTHTTPLTSPSPSAIDREHAEPLRADRGINLPDSALRVRALTPKDRDDLPFVARHADLVGLSFVERPDDVRELVLALAQACSAPYDPAPNDPAPSPAPPASTRRPPGIVLKIETRRAFEQLPALLLEAMSTDRVAVMIARGDLAIECGFERLAEVQEEILWVCEAAHVPVIWATQVLDTLAKKGVPSRAEVTDAAMAERAECVMLNKGPYIERAVRALADILSRMGRHQRKKVPLLRPLGVARALAR